jgi:hypothetical protein
MNNIKRTHTTFFLIFSILALIVVVLLFIFFLKVIKNKNEHISVAVTTLEEKMKAKENAVINASKVTEIKSIQNTIDGYFVDPNKIDTFVDYLEKIGLNLGSNVSVDNIEIPPNTKNLISFRVSITGTFNNVMKTITLIENIPYQVNVTRVYLNKKTDVSIIGKNTKPLTWQADVSFNILGLD